jgi:hypothetical protein
VSEKKSYEKVLHETPDERNKKYILRKRQEFEATKELKEFFYKPMEFPIDDTETDLGTKS